MPNYQYQALDNSGRLAKGTLQAEGEYDARKTLREMQFDPIKVELAETASQLSSIGFGRLKRAPKLAPRQLALLTRQLATLILSGLPLAESLELVGKQLKSRSSNNLITNIREDIAAGEKLESALDKHAKTFGALYIASVAAGESTGRLGSVLQQLASHLERQADHRQALASAMVYPSILVVLSITIVAALMTFVVPGILDVAISSGQEIPGITLFLMSASTFSKQALFPLLLATFFIVSVWRPLVKALDREAEWHHFLLRVPLLKSHLRSQLSARYTSTLALLSSAGIALTEAMPICARVTENSYAQEKLDAAAKRVSEGANLRHSLEETALLPDFLLQLINIGEQSGELPQMLNKGALIIEDELQRNAQTFAKILEPTTLILMGMVVFFIVLGVMLPIINLSSAL